MKLYQTDKARQAAIDDIWKCIDKLGHLPCETLGGYGEATRICRHLSDLQDVIYNEADDKTAIKRYRQD